MGTILVTGDPGFDNNIYVGKRQTADSVQQPGTRSYLVHGGARLLHDLIKEVTSSKKTDGWKTFFGLELEEKELPSRYHAYCQWEPQLLEPKEQDSDKPAMVWRAMEPPPGYGDRSETTKQAEQLGLNASQNGTPPSIIVIDDAGQDFRCNTSKERWPFPVDPKATEAPWLVLKLSGSIKESGLWQEIIKHYADKLVLIVSASQLRQQSVRISRGLSWEATVEDLQAELQNNLELAHLKQARHLIITFQMDAAFWLDNNPLGNPSAMLVFDAAGAEGDWAVSQGKGGVFGYQSCFTAAIVHELCRTKTDEKPDFETALAAGLEACRELRRLGHGSVEKLKNNKTIYPAPKFPLKKVAKRIKSPQDSFVSAPIPIPPRQPGQWMLLDEWQVHAKGDGSLRPHFIAALAVAVCGPGALKRFPVARFGDLQTIDRQEIECLRTLRQLISNYEHGGPQKKPLNLGVFGPPGAGKSFGVTQIAKAVLGNKVEILTFNLSQFNSSEDLNGAFHQIRDKVLLGRTPVVFWDEFDSQGFRWLQYLLAPMQDSAFQDGQISHPIGKSVFIFAGATSPTFDSFGPCNPELMPRDKKIKLDSDVKREVAARWLDFVLKKGPDFKSRLVGYLNVLGPNPRQECKEEHGGQIWQDANDPCFPIRRALFIRSQLKCTPEERLNLDAGVLRALLEIPKYKSGSRSLEFLCQQLRQQLDGASGRSLLPGPQLLDMHVDAAAFWAICERDQPYQAMAFRLAPALHEAYRLRIKGIATKALLDVPFQKLNTDSQAANLGQALRISENLSLIGLKLVEGPTVVPIHHLSAAREPIESRIHQRLEENLELLSEAEHNGWMVERMLSGWKYARKRDSDKKYHSGLIPYCQLSEEDKNFDRYTIIGRPASFGNSEQEQFGYVDIVKTAGFKVEICS